MGIVIPVSFYFGMPEFLACGWHLEQRTVVAVPETTMNKHNGTIAG